jgi:hypothetical protein
MAAGDTMHGQFRLVHVDAAGNRNIVYGPVTSREIDQTNIRDQKFLNHAPPGAANVDFVDHNPIKPGEALVVEAQVESSEAISSAHANAIAGNAISIVEKDLNTSRKYPRTLRVQDRATTGVHGITDGPTPTADAGRFTPVYAYVVQDRKAWYLKGRLALRVVENA